MSKTIPVALQTHIDSPVTTLATCWKITRTDGTIYRFTDHDQDIVVSGDTYGATTGYSASSVRSSGDMSVDNLDILGILNDTSITETDLVAGRYRDAEVEIFMVNFADPTDGVLELRKGWIGEITINRGSFVAELRGLSQRLQQTIGDLYSPSCRADLGDTKCGVNLVTFTVTGTVTSVASMQEFTDSSRAEASDWFNHGLLTWTSGNNNGLKMEVIDFGTGVFTLFEPMPFEIQVSDTYSVYAGCDKSLSTCKTKFSNIVNFRGEPFIPGIDQVLRYIVRS